MPYYHEQSVSRYSESHLSVDEGCSEVDAENGVAAGVADFCVAAPLCLLYGVVQTAPKHQH